MQCSASLFLSDNIIENVFLNTTMPYRKFTRRTPRRCESSISFQFANVYYGITFIPDGEFP